MSNVENVMAFSGGFLLGALIGGSIALLLAPQSGEEMRTQMKDQAEVQWHTWQEKGKETLDKSRHSAVDTLHHSKERLMGALNQGKESLGHVVSHHPNDTPEMVTD